MTTARRATPAVLWTLQFALAITFFLLGLLKAGLPLEELQQRLHLALGAPAGDLALVGWLEVAGGLLLVIPAVTGFLPRLTPLAAAYLAVTMLLGAALPGSAAGLGHALPDLGLGLACATVAIGRAFLAPIAPLDLGPEPAEGPRPLRPVRAVRTGAAPAAGPAAAPREERPSPDERRWSSLPRRASGH